MIDPIQWAVDQTLPWKRLSFRSDIPPRRPAMTCARYPDDGHWARSERARDITPPQGQPQAPMQ